MKSFKSLFSEVAEPKSEEEKRFKDQHKVDVVPHPVAPESQHKGTIKPKAKRKADQEGDANYDVAYNESVEQIDEISKKTLGSYVKKASDDMANNAYTLGARDPLRKPGSWNKAFKRRKGIEKATDRLTKEEAENLDELKKSTLASYIKKASGNMAGNAAVGAAQASSSMKKSDPSVKRDIFKRAKGISRAADKLANESVEQLDELSPNTLHSYIKGAGKDLAKRSRMSGYDDKRGNYADGDKNRKKANKRLAGITGASGRLADKANMAENWQEEIPMMMRQLEFIAYAAEEIMDYVEMAGDPEEWFQNKISGIHQSMLSMYAYAQGGRRAGYGFDESVEEELKGGQKKLDHNKNGKIDAHDFHMMRKKKKNEEVELEEEVFAMDIDYNQEKRLAAGAKAAGIAIKFVQAGGATEMQLRGDKDKITKFLKARRVPASEISSGWFNEESEQIDEVSQKTLWNYHAKAGADLQKKREKLDKGTLTMKDLKKGQNRVKGLNRAADKMHEEVEVLDEAFKQGIVKLKDGSSVTLNKEDAGLLNQMFKDLSSTNRKKMQEVAMKDKAGFEEILGFAREAL